MAWVFVHELPHGAVNVGGKPAELPVYRAFDVPQGLPALPVRSRAAPATRWSVR